MFRCLWLLVLSEGGASQCGKVVAPRMILLFERLVGQQHQPSGERPSCMGKFWTFVMSQRAHDNVHQPLCSLVAHIVQGNRPRLPARNHCFFPNQPLISQKNKWGKKTCCFVLTQEKKQTIGLGKAIFARQTGIFAEKYWQMG